jgi:hypothetical protein
MPEYEIDFSAIPPATKPDDAYDWFDARAKVVTDYNVKRRKLNFTPYKDELDFTTVAIAHLEAALRGDGSSVTQVNETLLDTQPLIVGTTIENTPCKDRFGEYDVVLCGLMPIMYRYRRFLWRHLPLLYPEVYGHVLHDLLTMRGPHDPNVESVLCVNPLHDLDIPETENHLLMIESSRFLTNQLLAEEARHQRRKVPEEFNNDHNGMTEYILKRLQGFLMNDFFEYG